MKKVPEITLARYISDREEEIIRKLELTSPELIEELESIHYFEKARASLYRSISAKLNKSLSMLRSFIKEDEFWKLEKETAEALQSAYTEGWTSSYENNRFKIYAKDFPVRLYWKKISTDFDSLNHQLSLNVAKMIRSAANTPVKLDTVFVWINFYMPTPHYDIDNSYYKPIIDGIVRSGLIKNDDITDMSFGFKGYYDKENPHMEIYIYPEDNINFCEILSREMK
ncbi:hypothetical protein JK636_18575 [Clostridium sp. YIM B02515]|uniref:Uncharacterized protein n=1 Tax=Clostridium rhizosphaerae TaxID=2803861 RepID=A0ABS1TEE3_9CLOT|nr:hypothetical protein [Clostridium rhizosphaerae]MBL4937715.1 hypothetical protein [Clostridium rhizosphaerae]